MGLVELVQALVLFRKMFGKEWTEDFSRSILFPGSEQPAQPAQRGQPATETLEATGVETRTLEKQVFRRCKLIIKLACIDCEVFELECTESLNLPSFLGHVCK